MAIGAGVVLVVVGVLLVLVTGGDDYRVKARFAAASQMVKGNQVKSGGRVVGTVESIELTRGGLAELELKLDDTVAPLRVGTEATLRLASLSGVANRYVDLRIPSERPGARAATIADGGVISSERTTSAVDIDELFSLFDKRARQGLKNVIRGFGESYDGKGKEYSAGWQYLDPSLRAAQMLFAEVNRDTPLLERFVVASSRLMTDLADRDDDIATLVDQWATATGAIAAEEQSLSRAVGRLPSFMRRANTTFVNLRGLLDDADPLVDESLPVTPKLRRVLAQLRPLAQDARPVVRDLADTIQRPGKDNDLIELGKATLPLREVAVGPVRDNGAERPGSLPTSQKAFAGSRPHWAFFRPYSVDFTGWLDDFSHSGAYDANGSASRNVLSVNAFALVNGLLSPIPPELRNPIFDAVATRDQRNRCPGSAERPAKDGSNPIMAAGINCDPTQIPPGK
jgi:phospholipid/cholesterol/gamma-HCH transport system substrate-binding protein